MPDFAESLIAAKTALRDAEESANAREWAEMERHAAFAAAEARKIARWARAQTEGAKQ